MHKKIKSFDPIVKKGVKVLILGSMPGIQSLSRHEYYAHKKNMFWPIILKLFNVEEYLSYNKKKELVLNKRIGIWDVIRTCKREGSRDSEISEEKVNDISRLLKQCKNIKAVFLNGRKTESLFKKHFDNIRIHHEYLPSTSPAYPKTFTVKLRRWKRILDFL